MECFPGPGLLPAAKRLDRRGAALTPGILFWAPPGSNSVGVVQSGRRGPPWAGWGPKSMFVRRVTRCVIFWGVESVCNYRFRAQSGPGRLSEAVRPRSSEAARPGPQTAPGNHPEFGAPEVHGLDVVRRVAEALQQISSTKLVLRKPSRENNVQHLAFKARPRTKFS